MGGIILNIPQNKQYKTISGLAASAVYLSLFSAVSKDAAEASMDEAFPIENGDNLVTQLSNFVGGIVYIPNDTVTQTNLLLADEIHIDIDAYNKYYAEAILENPNAPLIDISTTITSSQTFIGKGGILKFIKVAR
jgi:hypothetical protein